MQFKQTTGEVLTPFDVSEWDERATAFVKELTALERLVFNDYFLTFYDKEKDVKTRFNAGFKAALMSLVDGAGNPVLKPDDEAAASRASLEPILRLFTYYLKATEERGGDFETAKKN